MTDRRLCEVQPACTKLTQFRSLTTMTFNQYDVSGKLVDDSSSLVLLGVELAIQSGIDRGALRALLRRAPQHSFLVKSRAADCCVALEEG